MKKLLILSTFGPDAARDWYAVQRRFIAAHTEDYDYAVYLHGIKDETRFDCPIIGRVKGELLYALPEMFEGMHKYVQAHDYENYLILDSDCFPIKDGWAENLLRVMGDNWYAAPVRTDNLDTFPHPCALFIRGERVREPFLSFQRKVRVMQNLVGAEVYDIGTGFDTEVDGQQILFPLVRSNFINPHPMLAAIYGDTFYHHGAGSRTPFFRSSEYWEAVSPGHELSGKKCFNWFHKDPEGFVATIRGVGLVEERTRLRDFFLIES